MDKGEEKRRRRRRRREEKRRRKKKEGRRQEIKVWNLLETFIGILYGFLV